jgi:hypothetical protein
MTTRKKLQMQNCGLVLHIEIAKSTPGYSRWKLTIAVILIDLPITLLGL